MRKADIRAIIPARGGSKRLPRKNLTIVNGHPLLAYTIMQAKASKLLSGVYVSTDDSEISGVARQYGAEVIERPAELASDVSSSEEAMLHAAQILREQGEAGIDAFMMLQCTSPVRSDDDIDSAIELFVKERADSLLSVCSAKHFLWRLGEAGAEPVNYSFQNRPRSQDIIPQFQENGSFYITSKEVLMEEKCRLGGKIVMYVMDFWSAFEIDDENDLILIQWIMKQRNIR